MGWLKMSKQELQQVEVLTEVLAGRRTTESAAGVLGVSLRQAQRLAARYRDGGGGALIHKSRGRPASNKLGLGVRELVLELVRQSYRDFGPTLAAEVLLERHGIEVSRETLRKWMVEAGVWLSRKQRRSFHQPRLRRECVGELIQIDGSEHRWFESRGEPCTLLVFIDDATSKLMQLRLVPSESTDSYFEALHGYLEAHGWPQGQWFPYFIMIIVQEPRSMPYAIRTNKVARTFPTTLHSPGPVHSSSVSHLESA